MKMLPPQECDHSRENLFRLQKNSKRYEAWLKENRERIAELAYLKAEARGFAPGHETEDWLAAEVEVAETIMPHEFFT